MRQLLDDNAFTVASSLLTLGAVVAAAAGDYDSLDWRFADDAGFGLAAVDAVLELEESFFAVGVYIIGDRRTAEGDGFLQDFADGNEKFFELVAGDGRGAAAGAKVGAE
jgi:hypothetical protein